MSDYQKRIVRGVFTDSDDLAPGSVVTKAELTGVKHDSGKPDLSLVSPYAIEAIGRVMTFGAKKYDRDNWRGGLPFSRLLAAALRHVMAYEKGETTDPESGESHISHALCCLMMVSEFEVTRTDLNDLYWQIKK